MDKNSKSSTTTTSLRTPAHHHDEVRERMYSSSAAEITELLTMLNTSWDGLDKDAIAASRERFGQNTITHAKKESLAKRLIKAFVDPFTSILLALVFVSILTDIVFAAPGEANPTVVIIITCMVIFSGVLQFVQETRSGQAAENLLKMITTTTTVQRLESDNQDIALEDIVVGDIVLLAAGAMIPADMRIIQAKDLFVSQSALTGESVAVEKTSLSMLERDSLTDMQNLAFMGTNVVSGTAIGVVIANGNDTLFGEMSKTVNDKPVETSFEKGVNSVAKLLIRFILVMVPIVFLVNGLTKHDWMQAILFSLAVAVGITPETLPMVVTVGLAKGAVTMSKQKTIIKNLNSIQNLGSMDILCTDKTGTLTQDRVILQMHLNIHGQEDARVLRHAFLNSYHQTGLKNLIDMAIINHTLDDQESTPELAGLVDRYAKVDEIPFDFDRRRMSVVVSNESTQLITKGAVEEMLLVCSYAEYQGNVMPLTDEIRNYITTRVDELSDSGMRVIAVAHKHNPSPVDTFSVSDETEMTMMGFLAFLDPPKDSTAGAIKALKDHGVEVKVLTGDNDRVARSVCRMVGMSVENIMLGTDLDNMNDETLSTVVEDICVFAKLSPQQKARVITALRNNGHNVGYMGDGINDAAAMKASDVGISVDTAVDIAKESADVILLEKDLMVLEQGLREGRKTYANMIKYIKMTASSNFGNMFSVLVASAFLPFIPMLPIQIILLNLVYDFSCYAMPWDNVDEDFIAVSRKWDASSVGRFMMWIGPTSSVFDITTYLLMYFVICPAMCGGLLFHQISDPAMQAFYIALFQTGWFVESIWTQTIVIHFLRTEKIPVVQSRASTSLTLMTMAGITLLTVIPFTGFGSSIGFASLPLVYFPWLLLTVVLYMALVTLFKWIYVRRYGSLL